jgi:hypothetical protein
MALTDIEAPTGELQNELEFARGNTGTVTDINIQQEKQMVFEIPSNGGGTVAYTS